MTRARTVTVAERRARLGVRHHLAAEARTNDPIAITAGLVALHATDPASVYLSAMARMPEAGIKAVEDAQYESLDLVRMLAMRRTIFVFTAESAPIIQAAASDAIAAQLRRRYGQMLSDAGIATDGDAWLARACDSALSSLAELGEATSAELGRATPLLQTKISLSEGKAYASTGNVTGWVTNVLAAEGRILRGRPLGSWIGNQYRWRPAARTPQPVTDEARAAARTELVRRWLLGFGPATIADVQWWTGWTLGDTRAALAGVATIDIDLEGTPGIGLAEDNEPRSEPPPWVALLPALDPTPMGWSKRDWYLGTHAPALFDRSGNVGPTVWANGRIAGGWTQRKDGSVVYRLLEDVGAAATRAIDAEAERIRVAIGPMRITPKFPPPLQRELTG